MRRAFPIPAWKINASDNRGGFTRAEHKEFHGEGEFAKIIADIAKDEKVNASEREDGRFDLREAVERAPGKRIKTAHGELYLTEYDGILVIIDDRFKKDHAGRGEVAVYARTRPKARHEIRELRLWADFALQNDIVRAEEIQEGLLGSRLRAWMNDETIPAEERKERRETIIDKVNEFHEEGLEEEGMALARSFSWPASFSFEYSDVDYRGVLSAIFALLPRNVHTPLLSRINKIGYSPEIGNGDGSCSEEGEIVLGACFDPLYFVELVLHEIGHLLDYDLHRYAREDKPSHDRTDGLCLYLLYPEEFRKLADENESWSNVYRFYKDLFGQKEYSQRDSQPIFALIQMVRNKNKTELHQKGYLREKGFKFTHVGEVDVTVKPADLENEDDFDFVVAGEGESEFADPTERQRDTTDAIAAAAESETPIRAIMVVDGVSDDDLEELEEELNLGLYRNGFAEAQPGTRRRSRKNREIRLVKREQLKEEIDDARRDLPDGCRNRKRVVTVFAPEDVSEGIRAHVEGYGEAVNVINDGLSDRPADVMARYAIARLAFSSGISAVLEAEALEAINAFLDTEIDSIEGLFAPNFILKIAPVNWGDWKKMQKATATAV